MAGDEGDERSEQGQDSRGDERGYNDGESNGDHRKQVSPWEWVVAAIGLTLVVGTIGFMLYRAFVGDDAPPELAIEVDGIERSGDGYLVSFTATNRGDITAAAVVIEGELRDDTGSRETSMATITYVPGRSQRQGGLFFAEDPRRYRLEVRAKGFEEP